MSDWYRSGRDNDQGRYGAEDRDRRDFGAQERWRNPDRSRGEPRSFDEPGGFGFQRSGAPDRRVDPDRGGYGGQGFGGPDFTPRNQDYRARDWRDSPEDFRRHRAPDERDPRYDDQGYRGQSYSETRYGGAPYGTQGRAAQFYPSGPDYGPVRQDQGAIGRNPPLQRVADGDTDPAAWRADMGPGLHRGRGPKNYTRSDERIREDVNDRLSDDAWLDASEIEVQVKSCEVTLAGAVQTREDKRRAEDIVERVSGVKHVQNNLRVEPHPTQNPRMTPVNAGGSGPAVT